MTGSRQSGRATRVRLALLGLTLRAVALAAMSEAAIAQTAITDTRSGQFNLHRARMA
jgi:hypothetical protein